MPRATPSRVFQAVYEINHSFRADTFPPAAQAHLTSLLSLMCFGSEGVEEAACWVMASAGPFWMWPRDLTHLWPRPEAPTESDKCYSAA